MEPTERNMQGSSRVIDKEILKCLHLTAVRLNSQLFTVAKIKE